MSGRVRHRSVQAVQGPAYRPGTDRIVRPKAVEIDWTLVDDLRNRVGGSCTLPATGACHDCGRAVASTRRFCGPCFVKHP